MNQQAARATRYYQWPEEGYSSISLIIQFIDFVHMFLVATANRFERGSQRSSGVDQNAVIIVPVFVGERKTFRIFLSITVEKASCPIHPGLLLCFGLEDDKLSYGALDTHKVNQEIVDGIGGVKI